MTHIMVLADGFEKRYDTFSYQRQGFAGRDKKSGTLEVLPPEAITVIPASQLIPELNEVIQKTIEAHIKEISPQLVAEIIKQLEQVVDANG